MLPKAFEKLQTPKGLEFFVCCLEQAGDFTGFDIHIDTAVGRVGTGAGHQGDGAANRADELGAAVDQEFAHRQPPTLGGTLLRRIVGEGQVGLTIMVAYSLNFGSASNRTALALASGAKSTPSAPYTSLAIISTRLRSGSSLG